MFTRPSVCGCLQGFTGLLDLQKSELQAESILTMARALLELDVPELGQADRMLALTVLSQLMQVATPDGHACIYAATYNTMGVSVLCIQWLTHKHLLQRHHARWPVDLPQAP